MGLIMLVGLGMLSIGTWFWRWQAKARVDMRQEHGTHVQVPFNAVSRTPAGVDMTKHKSKKAMDKLLKVVLTEDIEFYGQKGDVVDVKEATFYNWFQLSGKGLL